MIICPACGISNTDLTEYCAECLGELPRAVGATPTSAVVAAPTEVPSEAPAGSAVCPRHPEMPAAGTCRRCGRFYCLTCVPDALLRKSAECPDCVDSREEREAPETIASIIKEMWIAQLVVAFVIAAFIGVFGSLVRDATDRFSAVALAGTVAIFTVPFLVCAALIAATRSVWSAWIGFALEVLVFGVLALMTLGANCTFLVAIGVPIYTLVRVLKLRRLVSTYPHARQRAA